jgi:hypothetical protein
MRVLPLPPLPDIEAVFSSRKSGLAVHAMSRCRCAKALRHEGLTLDEVEEILNTWKLHGLQGGLSDQRTDHSDQDRQGQAINPGRRRAIKCGAVCSDSPQVAHRFGASLLRDHCVVKTAAGAGGAQVAQTCGISELARNRGECLELLPNRIGGEQEQEYEIDRPAVDRGEIDRSNSSGPRCRKICSALECAHAESPRRRPCRSIPIPRV